MRFKTRGRSLLDDLEMRIASTRSGDGMIRLPEGFDSWDAQVREIFKPHMRYDLATMERGQIVVAETEHSKFWFARTLRSRVAVDVADTVQGYMVQTTSPDKAWVFAGPPDDTYTDRYIRLGEPMYVGRSREETSRVLAYGFML